MPDVRETIFAPELAGGEWLQGGPLALGDLRGRAVVLIDFWDYTCVNCIRTLPYVIEWHRRYEASGLAIVGVHAPEFQFAHDHNHVAAAVSEFGLHYPIVIDNDYAIWRAYSNRYWPAKYLIDPQGRIRYVHFGEGGYGEIESRIQRLLREFRPDLTLPTLMEPVRETDLPGAVCYRVTPELYLGYARGQFGNAEGPQRDRAHDYRDLGPHPEGMIFLGGQWTVTEEFSRADAPDATIALRYTAREVNLVLAPPDNGGLHAQIQLDEGQQPGADVKPDANGALVVDVRRARMYNLVANDSVSSGGLRLKAQRSGLAAYAFTFTSSCVTNQGEHL